VSTFPAAAPSAPRRGLAASGTGARAREESEALRLAVFFAFAEYASLQYATLLEHAPAGRVLGAAAIATAGGAALALGLGRLRSKVAARAGAVLVVFAVAALVLLAVGIPARLLLHWGALGERVSHGLQGLEGWLWPFRGAQLWPRLTVLALLAPVLALAAALCFWPERRGRAARGLLGLALLLALTLAGIVNQHAPAWHVQGLALALLVAAWLWLPALGARERHGVQSPPLHAGAWLLAALFGALVLAPVVGSRTPWIDYRAWDPVAPAVAFDWNQTYGPIAWSRSPAAMLSVSEPSPELLRITTLDRFDGARFVRSAEPPGSRALDLGSSGLAARLPAHGVGGPVIEHATISVSGLRSPLLVGGGGRITEVEWLGGGHAPPMRHAADGTIELASVPGSGARYRVTSYIAGAPPELLRRVSRSYPRAYLPYASFQLPPARPGLPGQTISSPAPGLAPANVPALAHAVEASPYARAFALARRLAAGAGSSDEVVEHVERYLRTHYSYSEHPPTSAYPLETFLFGTAGGYCQQFSGAMALLLRMDGIPARIAAGFEPTVFDDATGEWVVRALDAHSWVEVYFSGVGWVPFDPTPPAQIQGLDPIRSDLSETIHPAGGTSSGTPGPTHTSSAAGIRRGGAAAAGGVAGGSGSVGWGTIAALALAAALLPLLAWRAGAGARRLRNGLRGDAAGAVAELRAALSRVDAASWLAPGAGAELTLGQLARRLEQRGCGEAAEYANALCRARFAAGAAGDRGADRAPTTRGRRALRAALGAGHGLSGRVRALLALPPGLARRV
jgi:hypothetical protein